MRRNAALRDLAATLGVQPSPPATCTRTHARRTRAPGHARRDPLPHLARRLRAGAARQPRERPAAPGRRWPSASRTTAARSRAPSSSPSGCVRPHRGARLPLSRLLRRRRAGERPARRDLRTTRSPTATPRANGCTARARERLDERARADRRARPLRLLPAALGGAGARARGARCEVRGRGSPRHAAAAGAGARQLGRLDRLLPHRPLARRSGRGEPLARPLPQPRAVVGAGHRPRLPARHPREADRRASPSGTATSRQRSSRASPPIARAARSATSARRSGCRTPSSSGSPGSPTAGKPRASRRSWRRCRTRSSGSARRAGARFGALAKEIAGLPRHISQHPGGMVISSRPLIDLVPVQPAAMAGRQICQWDKDSCADAGFLKIDLLGLGMLSAVEECVDRIARHARRADRPLADPARRPARVRGDPAGGHGRRLPDREPRADAEPAADAAGEPRRPHRAGRARPAGADPGQGRASLHRAPAAAARGPVVRASRSTIRRCASRCATRSASSSSRIRCSTWRWRSPGFTVGEAEGLRRAMSRKRSRAALEAYRGRSSSRARRRTASTRRWRTRLRQARRLLRLRLPEVACSGVRAARVPVSVAAPPLSARSSSARC